MPQDFQRIEEAYKLPKSDFLTVTNPSLNDIREAAEMIPNQHIRTGFKLLAANIEKQSPSAAKFPDMPIIVANLDKSLKINRMRLETKKRCCASL